MAPNGFDDLHDPAPPAAGTDTLAAVATRARAIRRRRSALAGAGTVGVVALVIGAIVALGGPADRIVPADETPVPTTFAPETTDAPSPDTTAPASTSIVPATEVAGDDPCRDRPGPPPWLLDGSSPGEATILEAADGSVSARWGDEGSTAAVTQVAIDPAVDWFGTVEGTDQLVTSASARAAVVPIGDGAIGVLRVAVSDDTCDREYVVGPGVELDEAIAFAQDWVDALAAWSSLTTSEGALDRCVTVGSSATSACVATVLAGASGSTATAELTGTSLLLVLAVGPEGTAFEAPSSLTRSERLPGSSNVVLTDVIRRSTCGGVDFPDAPGSPLGTACPDAPEPGPAGTAWIDVVAVDGDGDVVVFDAAGRPNTVYDGTDPDDPPPAEGEVTVVDGATFASDGSGVLVGLCCEPIPGSVVRVDPSTGAADSVGFGRLPAATRYGNVVWATLGLPGSDEPVPAVVAGFDDGSIATTLQSFPLDSRIVDLAVVPDTTMPDDVGDLVLVLLATPDGVELRRFFAAGGDMMLTSRISDVPWTEDAGLSLAGWRDGVAFVLDRRNRILREYGLELLEIQPAGDVLVDWISAWFTPDGGRYVTSDRRLFVDEVEVPGEYVWVR